MPLEGWSKVVPNRLSSTAPRRHVVGRIATCWMDRGQGVTVLLYNRRKKTILLRRLLELTESKNGMRYVVARRLGRMHSGYAMAIS
jgi:hypothetical protein